MSTKMDKVDERIDTALAVISRLVNSRTPAEVKDGTGEEWSAGINRDTAAGELVYVRFTGWYGDSRPGTVAFTTPTELELIVRCGLGVPSTPEEADAFLAPRKPTRRSTAARWRLRGHRRHLATAKAVRPC